MIKPREIIHVKEICSRMEYSQPALQLLVTPKLGRLSSMWRVVTRNVGYVPVSPVNNKQFVLRLVPRENKPYSWYTRTEWTLKMSENESGSRSVSGNLNSSMISASRFFFHFDQPVPLYKVVVMTWIVQSLIYGLYDVQIRRIWLSWLFVWHEWAVKTTNCTEHNPNPDLKP